MRLAVIPTRKGQAACGRPVYYCRAVAGNLICRLRRAHRRREHLVALWTWAAASWVLEDMTRTTVELLAEDFFFMLLLPLMP